MRPITSVDKLADLVRRCKGSVSLEINPHRDSYSTAKSWLEFFFASDEMKDAEKDLAPEVRAEMVERDRIVVLIFYPDTPIGFHRILHWDLEQAIAEAMFIFGVQS